MERVDLKQQAPPSLKGAAITLGCFDGIHLGHQEIIRRLQEEARKRRLKTALCLLHPHPQTVLRPAAGFKRLFSIDETEELLRPFGLDFFCLFPFDKATARLSPQTFIADRVMPRLAPKLWLAGYDFAFGAGRSGGFPLLQKLSSKFGFEAVQVPPLTVEDAFAACAGGEPHLGGPNLGEPVARRDAFRGASATQAATRDRSADRIAGPAPGRGSSGGALCRGSVRSKRVSGKPGASLGGLASMSPAKAAPATAPPATTDRISPTAEEPVSASKIKKLLLEGRVQEASRLLGRPFFFSGTVVKGSGRGRSLGFPTANLLPPPDKAPLKRGVYIIEAATVSKGRFLPAVMNIGFRPTFSQKAAPAAGFAPGSPESGPQRGAPPEEPRPGAVPPPPPEGQAKPSGGLDAESPLSSLSSCGETPSRLYYEAHIIESAAAAAPPPAPSRRASRGKSPASPRFDSLNGRALSVRVHCFLREERAFPSSAALRRQIQKDIQKALKFFALSSR